MLHYTLLVRRNGRFRVCRRDKMQAPGCKRKASAPYRGFSLADNPPGSQLCVTAARQAASPRTRHHPVRRHRRYYARLGQHSPPYMLPPIPELWVWRVPPSSTNSCCALQLTCFDHGAQVTVQANGNRCDLMHYPRAKNLICSTIHTWTVPPSPAAASLPSGAHCGAQRTRDRKAVPASPARRPR